jgi:hypothetical protein
MAWITIETNPEREDIFENKVRRSIKSTIDGLSKALMSVVLSYAMFPLALHTYVGT